MSRLVYSTDSGRMCPDCGQSAAACICKKNAPRPTLGGVVSISHQTKGRGGKTVTLVSGLPLEGAALAALAKQLRAACGSGGTIKAGTVEVQGAHGEKLIAVLTQLGYAVKGSSGQARPRAGS